MGIITTESIKIYHIVHISRLSTIISDGFLFSDSDVKRHPKPGETIGMNKIKERRLNLPLASHPGLHVGECVPFYFCPRSIMLYVLHRGNSPDIEYRGGQEHIVHLVSDLHKAVDWSDKKQFRWAISDSNAGSRYFEDFADLCDLDKIDWQAVRATQWNDPQTREKKQAEFLIEHCFPWELIEEIGTYSIHQFHQVNEILGAQDKQRVPLVRVEKTWYY